MKKVIDKAIEICSEPLRLKIFDNLFNHIINFDLQPIDELETPNVIYPNLADNYIYIDRRKIKGETKKQYSKRIYETIHKIS